MTSHLRCVTRTRRGPPTTHHLNTERPYIFIGRLRQGGREEEGIWIDDPMVDELHLIVEFRDKSTGHDRARAEVFTLETLMEIDGRNWCRRELDPGSVIRLGDTELLVQSVGEGTGPVDTPAAACFDACAVDEDVYPGRFPTPPATGRFGSPLARRVWNWTLDRLADGLGVIGSALRRNRPSNRYRSPL